MLQSSYEKVLNGKARFSGRSSLKTWFFGVIRRTSAEARRRSALRRLLLMRATGDPGDPGISAQPDAQGIGPSERARVLAALEQLPRRQHEVLELVFYQDLSISEAAAVMGVSLGSARTHYHRGKAALALSLGALKEQS